MAHYAFLNSDNIVTEVIPGRNEDEVIDGISDWEAHYASCRPGQTCKRTSYNNNYRKNYAGIGYKYDPTRDAFIAPKPYASWVLNEETCRWESPVAMPTDGKLYRWDEESTNWVEVPTN